MKSQVIQDEPDPGRGAAVAAPAAAPAPATSQPGRSARGDAGSPLRIGFGGLALLIALAVLAGGIAVLAATGKRDADGFFMSGTHRLATPSSALVIGGVDIDADVPDFALGGRTAATRVQASAAGPVFVGIGPTADVERYLGRVRHAEVTDFDTDPFRVTSHLVPGRARAAAPASQGFWRAQSSGAGERTVTWPLESGRWSVVMMNADGSPAVDVQARLGARVPSVRWVGIGLLAGGAVLLLAGGLLLRSGLSHTSEHRGS